MPVLPAVAIILPLGLTPELSAAVLHNCDLAIGSGGCSLTNAEDSSNAATWLARVIRPAEDRRAVRVELVPAVNFRTTTTYSRWLSFDDIDRPLHQWSAVGVVIAALAIAAEAERNRSVGAESTADNRNGANSTLATAQAIPNAETTAKAKAKAPKVADHNRSTEQRFEVTPTQPLVSQEDRARPSVDVGALFAPGLEAWRPRYGVTIRPAISVSRRWAIGGELAASRANGKARVSWYSGGFGLTFVVTPIKYRWSLETRLFGGIEGLTFSASDTSGATDQASRWRGAVTAGINAVVPFAQAFGWFIAVDGQVASPRIRVQIASNEVAQIPTNSFELSTGLRWRIDSR